MKSKTTPAIGLTLLAALALVACGGRQDEGEPAAKVDGTVITAQQVNFALQQQRNLRPEQTDAASRQIVERLVDQQLAVKKAEEQHLERDTGVQQALEAVRREVMARAYAERLGETAVKPTPEDIKKYYDGKPALFAERRIYNLQEISIDARGDRLPELREKLSAAKNTNEFVEYLKAQGLRFSGNQVVRAAEQLPFNTLDAIAQMKDGQAMIVPGPNGATVQVLVLAGSRSQPVTEEQARPSIEQYLLGERRRKIIEDDLKAMRTAAKIEYLGKFADGASPAAGGKSGAVSMPAPPASGLTSDDINKGPPKK
jgi:EpsD family peptidyl-prolyl cis-trans isomerase